MTSLGRLAIIAMAAMILTGCETMKTADERTAECAATDWGAYGKGDGAQGVPKERRAADFAECEQLGHPPNMMEYELGYGEGLVAYCTEKTGYEVGRAGRKYREVCPPHLEVAFLRGYARGAAERPAAAPFYPYFGLGIGVGGFHGRHSRFFGHYGVSTGYPWYY